jgi:hypothetical protein
VDMARIAWARAGQSQLSRIGKYALAHVRVASFEHRRFAMASAGVMVRSFPWLRALPRGILAVLLSHLGESGVRLHCPSSTLAGMPMPRFQSERCS